MSGVGQNLLHIRGGGIFYPEKCSIDFATMFKLITGPTKIGLYLSKKLGSYDEPIGLHLSISKVHDDLKIEENIGLKYSVKIHITLFI